MTRFIHPLVLCLVAAAQPLAAEGVPKALTCRFPTGTTVTYTQGTYETAAANPLAFASAARHTVCNLLPGCLRAASCAP